jgi:hypothetical protein
MDKIKQIINQYIYAEKMEKMKLDDYVKSNNQSDKRMMIAYHYRVETFREVLKILEEPEKLRKFER